MRGRPFERGNTFGQGRPRGSPNKKSLALQKLLLEHGPEIIETVIDRATKGERTALALCMERLIPRLKEVAELPLEQPREGAQVTTDQHTETPTHDYSKLTREELELLKHLVDKAQIGEAGSDRG